MAASLTLSLVEATSYRLRYRAVHAGGVGAASDTLDALGAATPDLVTDCPERAYFMRNYLSTPVANDAAAVALIEAAVLSVVPYGWGNPLQMVATANAGRLRLTFTCSVDGETLFDILWHHSTRR